MITHTERSDLRGNQWMTGRGHLPLSANRRGVDRYFQHRTTSRWRTARGARAFGWLAGTSGLPLKLKDDPSCSEPNRDPVNLSATHAGGGSSLRRPKLPSHEAGSYMGATPLLGFRRRHDRRMAVIEHILIAHRHRWRGPYRQNAILL